MYVYEKVRAYIIKYNIEQDLLVQKTGIPAPVLTALLSGKQTMYAEELKVICEALNVSSATFIDYKSAWSEQVT